MIRNHAGNQYFSDIQGVSCLALGILNGALRATFRVGIELSSSKHHDRLHHHIITPSFNHYTHILSVTSCLIWYQVDISYFPWWQPRLSSAPVANQNVNYPFPPSWSGGSYHYIHLCHKDRSSCKFNTPLKIKVCSNLLGLDGAKKKVVLKKRSFGPIYWHYFEQTFIEWFFLYERFFFFKKRGRNHEKSMMTKTPRIAWWPLFLCTHDFWKFYIPSTKALAFFTLLLHQLEQGKKEIQTTLVPPELKASSSQVIIASIPQKIKMIHLLSVYYFSTFNSRCDAVSGMKASIASKNFKTEDECKDCIHK